MKALFLCPVVVGLVVSVGACGGNDPPPGPASCVENLQLDCSPLFLDPPVYSKIYPEIIQKQCALGSSCHSADAKMGGLALGNADDAYRVLLGQSGGKKYVVPNDPACSPLMVRLESRDKDFVMPQGMRLEDPVLCDFVRWIALGAQQN